ncbi:MAG: rhomboid family intramembrane serine protease [Acidimicrobiales bacterium]
MTQPLEGPQVTTCYRHPDRRAGVSCQRCDRPICPSCMVQASVGFHCPECTKQAAKRSPVITTRSLDVQPIVTQVLIALNAAAFVYLLARGGTIQGGGGAGEADYALWGAFQPRSGLVIPFGVSNGEWYRLITGGFLHASIIHIGMNMLVLWLIGNQLERVLGHWRFLSLYAAALLAGSFAVMLYDPGIITVGASGAIFGLFGAALAYQRDRGINIMQSGLGGLILINLLITFAIPGISKAGHLGGLIGGALVGFAMFEIDKRVRNQWVGVALAGAFSVAFLLGGIWAANAFVTNGTPVIHF